MGPEDIETRLARLVQDLERIGRRVQRLQQDEGISDELAVRVYRTAEALQTIAHVLERHVNRAHH